MTCIHLQGFNHYLTGLDWNRYKRVITRRKKKLKSLYHKNVIATAPSKWLTKLANESEVFKNEAVCIPNCIDTSVFKSLKREAIRFIEFCLLLRI